MAICPHCESPGDAPFEACSRGDGYFLVEEDDFYSHSDDPWLGRRLGNRFIVASILGKGSMGVVYKAYQAQVDRMVAIKLFQTRSGELANGSGVGDRARFVREAQVLAKLSHPNCVTLYDFGYDDDEEFLYIAMEYVAGISLRHAVRRGLKFDAIVEVVRQVLMALREAHALEIVHRDLKPENIILSYRRTSDEQIVKVLDFGIAKLLGQHAAQRTRAGLLFGTPAYMSPEQCRGETDVLPASDIYSLGCLAFEMITGRLPFDSNLPQEMVRQHQYEPVPPLVARKGIKLPGGIEEFVLTCLEKEPENRYAHAGSALKAFEEIVGGEANSKRLASGLAGLDDGGLSQRVTVPQNRITGAKLDPTGEWRTEDILPAEELERLNKVKQKKRDSGPVRVTDTLRGDKGSEKRGSGPQQIVPRAAGRGLVVAAVLAVLTFLSLLGAAIYVVVAG